MRRGLALAAVPIVALSFIMTVLSNDVSAMNRNELVSDGVYLNKNSMTQAQIQTFLESKNSALATYKDQGPNDTQQEPASYIIWHTAQIWGINPQLILATLQKEQSLITIQNPEPWRYQSAMGYGCPDSGQCNSLYYGFANQVNIATYQYRYNYEALVGHSSFTDSDGDIHYVGDFACKSQDTQHTPPFYNNGLLVGNTVTFSRNTAISGTQDMTLTIANAGTASLYCYTPHSGPYSTTGYSGSDNLVSYFTQWFGSPSISYNIQFENLAGPSGAVNKVTSQNLASATDTVSSGGSIYTFYYDATNKALRLSYWSGTKWTDTVIDGPGSSTKGATTDDVGGSISAVGWNGQIQLLYYDATTHSLRHAWLVNGQWSTETLDGATGVSKTTGDYGKNVRAIVWNGQLQAYYYDATTHSLRHAWWSNNRWNFETLDGTANSVSQYNDDVGGTGKISAAIWNGQIQLLYYDATTHSLRHAWWSNNRWNFETLDGTANSVGKSTDTVGKSVTMTPYTNQLQIYYYDSTAGSLKHAWWPGDGRWHFETFDGEPTKGGSTTVLGNYINAGEQVVVQASGNNLFVFYYDDATGFTDHTNAWRLAYWKDGIWNQVVLDGGTPTSESGSSAAVGGQLSVTFLNNQSVQGFYQGSDGSLRHVWFNY